MTFAQKVHLIGVVFYTIVAILLQKVVGVHWIHILNAGLLSSILYNLLDWKYSCEEGEENGSNN